MSAWEYAIIQHAFRNPKVYFLTPSGRKLVADLSDIPSGGPKEDACAQFIAKLGQAGWEMAAADGSGHLYFKRPCPE